MERIRLASPEEIDKIRDTSDLGPGCTVYTLANPSGSKNHAVVRNVVEIDPFVIAEDSPPSRRMMMIFGLETALTAAGIPFYYFETDASDEKWNATVKSWGCEQVTPVPSLRWKRTLS